MVADIEYYLGFAFFLGIGPYRFSALISRFGDVKSAYLASIDDVRMVIGDKLANNFVTFRRNFDAHRIISNLNNKHITPLVRVDPRFPKQLLEISDTPICLFVRGDLDSVDFSNDIFFGIVGTRRPTSYGIQVTHMFASQMAASGCVIVSGLAMGIDAAAHHASLESGGKTVAFLGCGIDIIYPRSNTSLYNQIVDDGGLIMSEFPPGRTVQRGMFVARNRLISGLSRGILVVEGTTDSGSLITAKYAAIQGKDVFAPPVPITSELSQAPNFLIKEGAKMVTSVEDILNEFNLRPIPTNKKETIDGLSLEEKELFGFLRQQAMSVDDLVAVSSYPIYIVSGVLSSMELKRIIEKNQEGKYQYVATG